ncbi:hypothetical protein SAMN04487936_101624 [Halobacillus dabanensis]|uniref:Uncharacterized protein n=1 Tax=Halobacillus dabanensis TaxID=240302 RepID=A0A1I3QC81_HALDA|nr:hypothetical protein [Halobacillus dabanensis]SFJ31142.1 hypothetical protein SAMN04487936_101624 [Halobacillus dabanensis]
MIKVLFTYEKKAAAFLSQAAALRLYDFFFEKLMYLPSTNRHTRGQLSTFPPYTITTGGRGLSEMTKGEKGRGNLKLNRTITAEETKITGDMLKHTLFSAISNYIISKQKRLDQ